MTGGLIEFKYFNADITCTMISLACSNEQHIHISSIACAKSWLLGYKATPLSLEEYYFVSKGSPNRVRQ